MPSLRDLVRRRSPPVAFVLGGGGNLGAIQVGMLRALVEAGIRPDVVVGCSVGALNGAAYAAEPDMFGVGRLEELWQGVAGRNLLPSGFLPAVQLARRGPAVHSIDGLREVVEDFLPVTTFEELDVRFECVATALDEAREVWFSSGSLVEPILASSAIPAVYPPVEVDGVRYLDGAVVNDIPVSRAVELGARLLYVLHVGRFDRPARELKRPLDVAVQAYWISRRHRFHRDLAALPPNVEAVLLPTGSPPDLPFNDFSRTGELITNAYEATAAFLASLDTGEAGRGRGKVERR
jgi:NTE family protein